MHDGHVVLEIRLVHLRKPFDPPEQISAIRKPAQSGQDLCHAELLLPGGGRRCQGAELSEFGLESAQNGERADNTLAQPQLPALQQMCNTSHGCAREVGDLCLQL